MLLIVVIFFVKIEFLSCIFENKNEQNFLEQINRERTNLDLKNFQIHLTLQLAAQKRCANQNELIQSYQKMITKSYRNDDWPKQEQLNKIFPIVGEIIYFNGFDNDRFDHLNLYRANFIYMGIAEYDYKNFSTRCILYGSSDNFLSNHRRLLRLLYILIGCGILLLSLIICSIINDRRQARLKQEFEEKILQNTQTTMMMPPQKSIIDRRTEMNRITMARLGSTIDERPSAVHSFFQSPK
jgi:hypothetical protein